MNKFYGLVGYVSSEEVKPGVWKNQRKEFPYYGDVLKPPAYSWQNASGHVNDNLTINNRISILADPYAYEHLHYMKYIIWNKVKWKIKSVSIEYPRIILEIGDVYND